MSTPEKPTSTLTAQIRKYIIAGGYPHIAAEANGVPKVVFERWLKEGRKEDASEEFKEFTNAITQAEAEARLVAETQAFKKDPLVWLKAGPGKPGWSQSSASANAKAEAMGAKQVRQEMQETISQLLSVLKDYPELRLELSEKLTESKKE